MYYDVNIKSEFEDFKDLEEVECMGFCVTTNSPHPIIVPLIDKPLYTRIDIEYSNKIDPSYISKLRLQFNVICIVTDSGNYIPSIIKLKPDLIRMSVECMKFIKKSTFRNIKENKLFIEMRISDGIYNSKERIQWMNACRRLLAFGGPKCLIISSGAKIFTETRSRNDIYKMMNIYGLSDDRIKKILDNSEIMLRQAAFERYTINGVIADSEDKGAFKRDFIINYHKKSVV